jgi:Flp pilus assembly protein TadG
MGLVMRYSIKALTGKFKSDASGVAAIEFALLAPVFLLLLLGVVEISRAVSMNRKLSSVTATVADLVAREKTITSSDVTAMYSVVTHIMKPWTAGPLQLAIIPVKADLNTGTTFKVYAATTNRATYNGASIKAKCDSYTLPAGMLGPGATMIVVEASYTFTPLFGSQIMPGTTWTDKAYLNPRNSCVDFDGTNCVSGCFAGFPSG